MASTKVLFFGTWLLTLAGGLVVLGGLGSLTADYDNPTAPFHKFEPYRLSWTVWSLEVVGLLVTLYALVVGPFHHWRATVLFFYAAVTSNLIAITNAVLVFEEGLPGSNGTATRAQVTAAGLIVVLIGNFTQALLAAVHDQEEPQGHAASPHGSVGKEIGV